MPAGGWAWAVPSGWPESDDTAAVLGALATLGHPPDAATDAALRWLTRRQNRNGSWSEWVRNGAILNDGPCPAVTGQVIGTLREYGQPIGGRIARALRYLAAAQRPDGSYRSLWFRRYVFGTAKVLQTYATLGRADAAPARRARDWLLANQRASGAWAGVTPAAEAATRDPAHHAVPVGEAAEPGDTVEETSWAAHALLAAGVPATDDAIVRGTAWLLDAQRDGTWEPSPVGLYFDDLRYASDLVTHAFALRALGSARAVRR
jgi:squalene-hopene/tetraprenyl-beta-curcumene cyclase